MRLYGKIHHRRTYCLFLGAATDDEASMVLRDSLVYDYKRLVFAP